MKSYELHSGDRMPALGLGTWKAEPEEVGDAVREAIRIGYRHIDCAPVYQNQPEIGEALSAALSAGDVARDELWITSKLWNSDHLRDDVRPALEKTLVDLQLEYLDLYLIHWPIAFRPGVQMAREPEEFLSLAEAPLRETWAAMEDAVDAGLCRNIGVSNFTQSKINDLLKSGRIEPAVNQVESHPMLAQEDLLQWCSNHQMVFTAYSPLGSRDRPDRLRQANAPVPMEHPVIGEIASKHDATPAQVLLAWALQRDTAVIPKAINPEHQRENLAAADLELDESDVSAIRELDEKARIVSGEFWCPPGSPYTTAWLWT